MTSPTIIQTPGAIDTAVSGFMQAYQVARQLSDRRRELDLQAQRVASQTNLEGAQARDLQTKIDAGLADHAAANQANQVFAGLAASGDLNDPAAVMKKIGGVQDENVQAHFGTMYKGWLDNTQSAAAAQFSRAEAAQMQAATERRQRVDAGIQNVVTHWKSQLNSLAGVSGMLRDAAEIDTEQAARLAETFGHQFEGWERVVGNDGRLLFVNPNLNAVHDTGVNLGPKGTGGAQSQVSRDESVFALQNLAGALDTMDKLTRQSDEADVNPVLASMIAGAHVGTGGVGTGPNVGTGIANLLKSPEQNQFTAASQVFVHSLASVMPRGQRSMPLIQSLMSGYIPQAGLDKQARYALRQKRLVFRQRVLQLMRRLQQGQPADLTQLPGYNQDAQAAAAEQQGGGGAPGGSILDYLQPGTP